MLDIITPIKISAMSPISIINENPCVTTTANKNKPFSIVNNPTIWLSAFLLLIMINRPIKNNENDTGRYFSRCDSI